ncbi:hypothetical protein PoB_007074600 [Plakobranchus ocellatus]|uniref:Uncharacterized protein n=1 Tax=Plakobranchus ocellatus TaxID=259542 RepID=A0AAV4DJA2_9GAST|nr:hypothetical protein PoB_007074600 [Plakobranchus ocellatus]
MRRVLNTPGRAIEEQLFAMFATVSTLSGILQLSVQIFKPPGVKYLKVTDMHRLLREANSSCIAAYLKEFGI